MAASLLALGPDPSKCTLFVQSHRPEHTELAWLFDRHPGELGRANTDLQGEAEQPDDVNHGLLTYPILQAADIVIYHADRVPVGRDQAAHLEMSREIVRAFNRRYGDTFPEAEAVFTEAPVVLGTDGVGRWRVARQRDRDPRRAGRDPEAVMSMVTDTQRILRTHPGRPESAMSASSTASSGPTTRRSGTASGPPGPAASTRRSCWPTGSSPTTPRLASATSS